MNLQPFRIALTLYLSGAALGLASSIVLWTCRAFHRWAFRRPGNGPIGSVAASVQAAERPTRGVPVPADPLPLWVTPRSALPWHPTRPHPWRYPVQNPRDPSLRL